MNPNFDKNSWFFWGMIENNLFIIVGFNFQESRTLWKCETLCKKIKMSPHVMSCSLKNASLQVTFFLQKIPNFWADFFWGIWGIFGQTISTILALWKMCWFVFPTKTLVFRSNTYKSQISPKYDIGLKEFQSSMIPLK